MITPPKIPCIRRKRILTAVLLFLLALPACRTLHEPPGISVSLSDVRVRQSTLLETSGEITVRLLNESDRPLRIRGGAHALEINGTAFAKGVSDQSFEVAPFNTATVSVPVYISHVGLLTRWKDLARSGPVQYALKSRLQTEDRGRVRLSDEGSIDLPQIEP